MSQEISSSTVDPSRKDVVVSLDDLKFIQTNLSKPCGACKQAALTRLNSILLKVQKNASNNPK